MKQHCLNCFLLLLFFCSGKIQGQITFTALEDATTSLDAAIPDIPTNFPSCLANSTFQLTDELDWQTAAVWANTTINLTQNFVMEANLYFGDNNAGADGIVFVMQTSGTNIIGRTGGNIGYGNQPISGNDPTNAVRITPSVAIELDVFNNGMGWNDQSGDHLDIIYNGSTNNDGNNPTGANFNSVGLPNLEDGNWHQLRIEYIVCANNQCFNIFLDSNLIGTHCDNVIESVFNGISNVTWGFTAATGSSNNFQAFCLTAFSQSQPNFPTVSVADTTICVGGQATLSAVITGGVAPFDYEWPHSSNTIIGTQSTLITNTAGDYAVRITDEQGCTDADTATVTINNPLVTILGDLFLCLGESTTLTANVQNAINPVITWEESMDGTTWTPIGTGVTLTVNPTQDTRYRVHVVNQLGCQVVTEVQVNVRAVLLTVSADTSICEGETIGLTASAVYAEGTPNAIFNYTWTPVNQSAATITVNPSSTTTYTVVATSTDPNYGCTATGQTMIEVNQNPLLAITASPTGVRCLGDEVELTASNSTGTVEAVAWTGSAIGTPITINPAIVTAPLGTTAYIATVADSNGCHATDSIFLEVENCCPARGNDDYLQIDEGADLAALAVYGIRRTGVRTFLIDDGGNHILPNKVYIGDNVLLHVIGTVDFTTIDFTNSDVVVGRNGLIRVQGRGTIIAHNTIFRPCEEFETWQGVRIQPFGGLIRATFNECTFVNAMTGINTDRISARGNVNTSVEVTNNLFINCGLGIRIDDELQYNGGITGNTFKIDDKAAEINYRTPTTTFRGLSIVRQDRGMHYPISQNKFIKGTNFAANIRFEGMNLTGTSGHNISSNTFTNNDRAIVVMRSVNTTIENNFFEVTRRSNVDEVGYQVTLEGTANRGYTTLVKNNSFVSSAEVITPSNATNSVNGLFVGTGAIYIGNEGHFTLDGNDISGFEIGVFSDNAVSHGVRNLSARIVNNKIKAHLFGMYLRGFRVIAGATSGQTVTLLVACNEIDMDMDLNPTNAVIGIYFDPYWRFIGKSPYAARIPINVIFEGNCIKNTTTAIAMDYNNPNLTVRPYMPVFRHNYLYNYTDAGLYVNNLQTAGITFPTPNDRKSEGNTFISNNNAWDIEATNTGVISRNDHFGVDGMANLSMAVSQGSPIYSASSCGNQDLGMVDTDIVLHCDDDNDRQIGQVAQRNIQTGALMLNSAYATELKVLYDNNPKEALAVTTKLISALSDVQEIDALYQTALGYNWEENGILWLNYYYHHKKVNYMVAGQNLRAIVARDVEEADKVILEGIYLALSINEEGIELTDIDLDALNGIASHGGTYREEARNLLHLVVGDNPYTYPEIKLSKPRNTDKSGNTIEFDGTNFSIFPNPTTNNLNIQIKIGGERLEQASIYDVHGRLLQTKRIQAYQLTFDVSKLPQGIYFVSLQDADGMKTTKKFIKE